MDFEPFFQAANNQAQRQLYQTFIGIFLNYSQKDDTQRAMLESLEKFKHFLYDKDNLGVHTRFIQPMSVVAKIKHLSSDSLAQKIENYLIVQELVLSKTELEKTDYEREQALGDKNEFLYLVPMFSQLLTNIHLKANKLSFFQTLIEHETDIFSTHSHPVLRQAIHVLLHSLDRPEKFSSFVTLFRDNSKSFFIKNLKNNQEEHACCHLKTEVEQYYHYRDKEKKRVLLRHDQDVLNLLVSEFFLRYPLVYASYDVLPQSYQFLGSIMNQSIVNHYIEQYEENHYTTFNHVNNTLFTRFLLDFMFGLFWDKRTSGGNFSTNFLHLQALVKKPEAMVFVQSLPQLDKTHQQNNIDYLLSLAEKRFLNNMYASIVKKDYSFDTLRKTAEHTYLYSKLDNSLGSLGVGKIHKI